MKKQDTLFAVTSIAVFLFLFLFSGFPEPVAAADKKTPLLKIAFLPIIDSFPLHIAEKAGYFDQAGVRIKSIPVMSGLERDQLMQAGEIDGMLNEMTSVANFNRTKSQVKLVYTIRSAHADYPMFRVVAAPKSGLTGPDSLAGVPIGISKNTIIEYMTDRVLGSQGIDADKIEKLSIPVIPERFQLLIRGEIKVATLPDPLASAALAAGASLIIDDSFYPQFSSSEDLKARVVSGRYV